MDDGKVMVQFDHVSKRYHRTGRGGSLRDTIPALAALVVRRRPAVGDDDRTLSDFWALRDVSFAVRHGEALGIIGHNGAGKSTILKLLAGVTAPTCGRARVNGRVAALIELGAGFHPDLTGRENVYLNGSILGLKRAEIDRKLDSIIDFAGIETFIDTPVKRYSSGMQARLGFAVAAHMEPEVLLIDEVLSVGDFAFQQKCLKKMSEFRSGGTSIVFVSHNLDTVQSLCNRAVYLRRGQVMVHGASVDAVRHYLDDLNQAQCDALPCGDEPSADLVVTRLTCRDEYGRETSEFRTGRPLIIDVAYVAHRPISRPVFSIGLSNGRDGPLVFASMLVDCRMPDRIEGHGVMRCHIETLALLPRTYQIFCSVRDRVTSGDIVPWKARGAFRVVSTDPQYVDVGENASIAHLQIDAPVYLPYRWQNIAGSAIDRGVSCAR
jgi:ABC-type polysaccharide/polyol phosphate transport system ATPase subunit